MSIIPAMGSWRQEGYRKLEFSLAGFLSQENKMEMWKGGKGEREGGRRRKGRDRGEENISQ